MMKILQKLKKMKQANIICILLNAKECGYIWPNNIIAEQYVA